MTLRDFLFAVLGGGFAIGPALYALVEYTGLLTRLDPRVKRVFVAAYAAELGVLAWLIAVALGYIPTPADHAGVAEAVWTHGIMTGFVAFTSATTIHGALRMGASDGPR